MNNFWLLYRQMTNSPVTKWQQLLRTRCQYWDSSWLLTHCSSLRLHSAFIVIFLQLRQSYLLTDFLRKTVSKARIYKWCLVKIWNSHDFLEKKILDNGYQNSGKVLQENLYLEFNLMIDMSFWRHKPNRNNQKLFLCNIKLDP